jgi:hypothetical protein
MHWNSWNKVTYVSCDANSLLAETAHDDSVHLMYLSPVCRNRSAFSMLEEELPSGNTAVGQGERIFGSIP